MDNNSMEILATMLLSKNVWLTKKEEVSSKIMLKLMSSRIQSPRQNHFLKIQALSCSNESLFSYNGFYRKDTVFLLDTLLSKEDVSFIKVELIKVLDEDLIVRIPSDDNYYVESILAHRLVHRQNGKIEFLVKWLGYNEESSNTWQSFESIRKVDILHNYLIEQNLEKKIPKEFRHNYFI
jgi:Chromo (CHRromatin Organisation MOdifier) domain